MLKNLFAATMLAASLALLPSLFLAAPAQAQDAAAMQAEVEALIVEFGEDPTGLEAAIEAYVTGAADPELATQAVIGALTNPQDPAVVALLNANADLKIAAGRGLGAAIAMIALSNPTAAANMLAMVQASGDETLIASVNEGNDERTAGIADGSFDLGPDPLTGDSTPEEPASAD